MLLCLQPVSFALAQSTLVHAAFFQPVSFALA